MQDLGSFSCGAQLTGTDKSPRPSTVQALRSRRTPLYLVPDASPHLSGLQPVLPRLHARNSSSRSLGFPGHSLHRSSTRPSQLVPQRPSLPQQGTSAMSCRGHLHSQRRRVCGDGKACPGMARCSRFPSMDSSILVQLRIGICCREYGPPVCLAAYMHSFLKLLALSPGPKLHIVRPQTQNPKTLES